VYTAKYTILRFIAEVKELEKKKEEKKEEKTEPTVKEENTKAKEE
jgi:hypothetical protein